MVTPDQVIDEARSWVGTPFHFTARVKGDGVDCGGLIVGVAENLGILEIGQIKYGMSGLRPPRGAILTGLLERFCGDSRRIPRPGDIAVFWINGVRRIPQHLAILTHCGMIHACNETQRVIENSVDEHWRSRYICAYRLPGVE